MKLNNIIKPKPRISYFGNKKSKNYIDMSELENKENNNKPRSKNNKTSTNIIKVKKGLNFFSLIASKILGLTTSKNENSEKKFPVKSSIFSKSSHRYL